MFDLFRSRAKAVRYLLGGLLGLVALSMVITLIPGYGGPSGRASDTVVAEIGKSVLTVQEVQSAIQALVRGKQVPPALMGIYLPQQVEQMITERAVAYEAERLGFEVPDAELAETIRGFFPQMFQNGQLVNKAGYEQFLNEQGYTVAQFESNVRKQIQMKRLMDLALEGIVVTPEEAKAEYERRNAKIKVAYIAFKGENLKSQVKTTPEELRGYYSNNKDGFREPEKRDVAVLIADQDKVAAAIEVSDSDLRKLYDERKDSFRTPERAKVRHILFMTTGKSADEVNKIKAQAEDVRKQVNDKNFADLAKKYSEDTGSKEKGGDVGWVVRGQMVKNFEAASFAQKIGEISPQLISTEYGVHIVQVQERQEARLQPFEEVKAQLATEFKKAQVVERMQNSIDQARAALAKAPASYEAIARQYGLELVKAGKVVAGSPVPGVPEGPELETNLQSLKPGEVSQVFQLSPTKLAIAQVIASTPSRIATFEEAESHIREKFTEQRAQVMASERAKQAADRIKAGEDIQKVAKETGGEYKTSDTFNSDGTVEGLGAANVFHENFEKPVGTVVGPLNVVGQQVIAKTIEKIPADAAAFAAEREKLVLQLKQKKSSMSKDLFQDSILAKLIREGKVKKHEDTIKRMMAAYRSS